MIYELRIKIKIHSMMLENDADNTICRENLLYNPYDCYFHYRLQLIRVCFCISFTLQYFNFQFRQSFLMYMI